MVPQDDRQLHALSWQRRQKLRLHVPSFAQVARRPVSSRIGAVIPLHRRIRPPGFILRLHLERVRELGLS